MQLEASDVLYSCMYSFLTSFTLRLIRSVPTVVFSVTIPRLWDAATIFAGELSVCAFTCKEKKQRSCEIFRESTSIQSSFNFRRNPPQFSSSVLSPQSSKLSHLQNFGLQSPFLHLNWDSPHSGHTQKANSVSQDRGRPQRRPAGLREDVDSPQSNSSLSSPQSFQPSHCRVELMHRLFLQRNLPGQAAQQRRTVSTKGGQTLAVGKCVKRFLSYDWLGQTLRTRRWNPRRRRTRQI